MPRLCCARAVPRPCRSERYFSRLRHSAAWAWHGMCDLASAFQSLHVGDLPALGFFRLLRGLLRSLSEAFGKSLCTYKCRWQWCPRASILTTKSTYRSLSGQRLSERTVYRNWYLCSVMNVIELFQGRLIRKELAQAVCYCSVGGNWIQLRILCML
jgi:hypothetical protein